MRNEVRVGEVHDGEIIEVAGDVFYKCHFAECQLTGMHGQFYNCEFTECRVQSRKPFFAYCVFWGGTTPGYITGED